MGRNKKPNRISHTVRMPSELHIRIGEIARSTNVTVNDYLVTAIQRYTDEYDGKPINVTDLQPSTILPQVKQPNMIDIAGLCDNNRTVTIRVSSDIDAVQPKTPSVNIERVRRRITIDKDLWRSMKSIAVGIEMDLSSCVEEALRVWIAEHGSVLNR